MLLAIGLMLPMCVLAKITRVTSPNGKLVVMLNATKVTNGILVASVMARKMNVHSKSILIFSRATTNLLPIKMV